MTSPEDWLDREVKLVLLLRGVQFACDDFAFRLPKGQVASGELVHFADQLNVCADILRAHAAGTRHTS